MGKEAFALVPIGPTLQNAYNKGFNHPDAGDVLVMKLNGTGSAGTVGTGLTVKEQSAGVIHHTRIVFNGDIITMTDGGANGSIGNKKIYDLPAGAIPILCSVSDLSLVVTTGIDADAVLKHSVGTAPAATNDTLSGTKANIIPSTDCQLASSAGTVIGKSDLNSGITALTDNSGGSASDTIADVPGSYTEATLANQIASLVAKVNALIALQKGVLILDGTVTPADIYLNFGVANADSTANSTVAVTGYIDIIWISHAGRD